MSFGNQITIKLFLTMKKRESKLFDKEDAGVKSRDFPGNTANN